MQFEQGNEKDDGDPYVCFRRREVRQVRKTRRTDAQSTDKVKKLRQDLDTARNLVKDVLQRETMRKSGFQYEAQIFEHRRTLIATKRKLGLRGDDEDLVYYKVCIWGPMHVPRTSADPNFQAKEKSCRSNGSPYCPYTDTPGRKAGGGGPQAAVRCQTRCREGIYRALPGITKFQGCP